MAARSSPIFPLFLRFPFVFLLFFFRFPFVRAHTMRPQNGTGSTPHGVATCPVVSADPQLLLPRSVRRPVVAADHSGHNSRNSCNPHNSRNPRKHICVKTCVLRSMARVVTGHYDRLRICFVRAHTMRPRSETNLAASDRSRSSSRSSGSQIRIALACVFGCRNICRVMRRDGAFSNRYGAFPGPLSCCGRMICARTKKLNLQNGTNL